MRGFVLPQIALLLAAMAAIGVTTMVLNRTRTERAVAVETDIQLEAARKALVRYAMAWRRLPCPARGAAQPGDADYGRAAPDTATTACTAPSGILPWRTLGLDEAQSLDGWGRRISYRVFAGARGTTQSRGIDMTDCDTAEPAPAATDVAGLCPAAHATTPESFTAGKGFAVTGAAAPATLVPASGSGAAFVLVSHGATGRGAFLANGTQEPQPASQAELANLGNTGPFRIEALSAAGSDAAGASHFDDELVAATIGDVAAAAGLGARDWADEDAGGGAAQDDPEDEDEAGKDKEKKDKEEKNDDDEKNEKDEKDEKDEGDDKGNGWAWGQDKEGRDEWQQEKEQGKGKGKD